MNPIKQQCQKIKQQKRLGLMAHVVVGYPSLAETRELVNTLVAAGADFVELQIPFSDPMGDGTVIRDANTKALQAGVRTADAFSLAKQLVQEDRISIPLFFMTYFNIVFAYGLEKFCADAAQAGVSGLIIPDYNLDMESHEQFEKICKEHKLILQRFAAFDSPEERLRQQAKDAEGFMYCFSTRGTTGARKELDRELVAHLQKLRTIFANNLLAVGFGISNGDQVRALKGHADIIIIGSAMLKMFNEGGLEKVKEKMRELVATL